MRDYQKQVVEKIKSRLKEVTYPLCVDMSVGAGKSLCISEILLWIEKSGYRALCLTMNSTLIDQNANAYKGQNGNCGIYCSSLNSKDFEQSVIFGSPQSVCNGIINQEQISHCKFNLIIVDECHNVDIKNNNSLYMRIFNHFGHLAQLNKFSFRIIGMSGTCYRDKGESIVGEDKFFKEKVCEITATWLIEREFLVKPHFGKIETDSYDFSKIRINHLGKFNSKELSEIVDGNERLTGKIMRELVSIMQFRVGCFVFASSRRHCIECAKSLPDGSYAIITGETKHSDRKEILSKAKSGQIKFLISVNCLNVGVDIQNYDTCAWLRPTESLIIYVQGIGRVLRLNEGKTNALILDYAQNLIRHGDLDNLIINEALQPRQGEEDQFVIPCYQCASKNITTFNTIHARRCIGVHNGVRCSYYFEFKECPYCSTQNDQCARSCRECNAELIDPNAKLTITTSTNKYEVLNARYWVANDGSIHAGYATKENKIVHERFTTSSDKACRYFYGQFIKHHLPGNYKEYYSGIRNMKRMAMMLRSDELQTPYAIDCDNNMKIKRKYFYDNP